MLHSQALLLAVRFEMLNYVMSVILLQRIAIIVTTNILNLINRSFPYTIFVLHLQIANYTRLLIEEDEHEFHSFSILPDDT